MPEPSERPALATYVAGLLCVCATTGVTLALAGLVGPASGGDLTALRATAGLCTLIALMTLALPALAGWLLGHPAERFRNILTGGPPEGASGLLWWLVLALIAFAAWAGAHQSVAATYDLPEDVARIVALIALPVTWLLHRLAAKWRLSPSGLLFPMAAAATWLWLDTLPRVAPGYDAISLVALVIAWGLVFAELGARPRFRLVGAAVALLLLVDLGLSGRGARAGDQAVGRAAVTGVRVLADGDGDGFASALGGGDCDDSDPEVHPLALERVGNGVDDNCVGGDLAKAIPLPASKPKASGKRPDVVLISVDTLRADVLTERLMPALSAYAEGGRRFTRAYASASLTDLSLRSIFTGWPASDFDYVGRFRGLDRSLPDLLAQAGWQTFALHSVPKLGKLITLGFQQMDASLSQRHLDNRGHSAKQITERALGLLKQPSRKPRMLWVHYLDPHHRYLAHPGYEHLGDELAGLYHQEVAFTDAAMRPLLEWLARPEVAAKTVVVFFADHGEYLGEGGRQGHDFTLYEPVIRIPMVVRAPGLTPKAVAAPVSTLDIFPTVLELAGVTGVGPRAGLSLTGPQDPERAFLAEARASTATRPPALALRQGKWLLHCRERSQRCGLFDTIKDPLNQKNLIHAHSEQATQLRDLLAEQLDRYRNDQRYAARRAGFMKRWKR